MHDGENHLRRMSLKDFIIDVATLKSCGFLTQTTPKIAPTLTIIHSFQWHQPSCWSVASPSPALRRNTARTIRCSAAGASLDRTDLGIDATAIRAQKFKKSGKVWQLVGQCWAKWRITVHTTYQHVLHHCNLSSFPSLHLSARPRHNSAHSFANHHAVDAHSLASGPHLAPSSRNLRHVTTAKGLSTRWWCQTVTLVVSSPSKKLRVKIWNHHPVKVTRNIRLWNPNNQLNRMSDESCKS